MQLESRGGLGGAGRGGAARGRELLVLGRTQLEASRRGQWTVHVMENSVCSLDGLFPSSPISLSIKMHPPTQPLPILAERDSLEGCFCAGCPVTQSVTAPTVRRAVLGATKLGTPQG